MSAELDPGEVESAKRLAEQPVSASDGEGAGYEPQPPLTKAQIDEMNARRYPRFLSSEEIEYINKVRARGIHHGV